MRNLRKLFLVGSVMFAAGALAAHVTDHDVLRTPLQIFACNCFGFWCGLMMIRKARQMDDFQAVVAGIDALYEDPEQSDQNKKLIAAYAVDSLSTWVNRNATANPIKEN